MNKNKKTQLLLGCIFAVLFLFGCASHKTLPATQSSTQKQLLFTSPTEAVDALKVAVETKNKAALLEIFGPDANDLLHTGDAVADENAFQAFAKGLAEETKISEPRIFNRTAEGQRVAVLLVGKNHWPFPIAIISPPTGNNVSRLWHFDTAVGKQEIVNRRIGKNELSTISFCREYVAAQYEYFSLIHQNGKFPGHYAAKFFSSAGTHDGLYWPQKQGKQRSPIGPLVAQAEAQGYAIAGDTHAPRPFNGYHFRILTAQGKNARGGAQNFISNGSLVKGFAMIAYPAEWGKSGVMSFIVGPDGVIYESNLGPKTPDIAASITTFDPDPRWSPVH